MSGRFEFRRLADLNGVGPEHPLSEVDGAVVPEGRLEVWLGRKIVGGRYFRLDLAGEAGSSRLLHGLHNAGIWPGQNWAEVYDLSLPRPLAGREAWERELAPYLRPLAAAIPPGGHLMVEYESPLWRTTQLGLLSGIPPLATPLGGLLQMIGVVPRLSLTPGEVRHAGPKDVGADNEEVYGGRLGLSRDDLAALRARGIV